MGSSEYDVIRVGRPIGRPDSSHAKEWHVKQDNPRPGAATLSKPEAVWKAIEVLGARAEVAEILEYVRTEFGITADSDPPAEIPAAIAPATVTTPPAPPPAAPQPPAANQAETPAELARKPASQKKPRPRNDSAD
jgi:hypothetical protein